MAGDYEVGYKRPPKHSQFKEGRSGNPRGRPKGTRNLQTDLAEVLSQPIAVTIQGRTKKVTNRQALLLAQMAKGLRGDTRATAFLFNMSRLHEAEQSAPQPPDLSPQDEKILAAFIKEATAKSKKPKNDKKSNGGEP